MVRSRLGAGEAVDRAADPDRRPMRWLGLLVAACTALAFLLGGLARVGDRFGGPGPAPVETYLIDSNEQPPESFEVATLLGIEYGMTLEQVDALMPVDAVERTVPGDRRTLPARRWEWDGLYVTVQFDRELRTVSDPGVGRTKETAPHVLLPRGLILGRSQLRDFVAVFGAPAGADQTFETGRHELDIGWDVSTDVTDLFSVSIVVPSDVEPLSAGICSTVPYRYSEPAHALFEPDEEDSPKAGAVCVRNELLQL